MRDWLLVLAPIGLIVYFLVYPERFSTLVGWAEQFVG
jgi:hypothetical protein